MDFHLLDGDDHSDHYSGEYISQRVCNTRLCSEVLNFNERNKFITGELWSQEFRCNKLLLNSIIYTKIWLYL